MTSLTNIARTFFLVRPETLGDVAVEHKTVVEGATDIVGFNLAPVKNLFDTTVSTSTWEIVRDDGAASISSDTSDAISTQATVATSAPGTARLKNTITMSDSQVIVRFIDLKIVRINITKDYPSF